MIALAAAGCKRVLDGVMRRDGFRVGRMISERLEAGDDSQIEAVFVRVVLTRNRRQTERAVIHPKLQRAPDWDLRLSSKIPNTSGSLLLPSSDRP